MKYLFLAPMILFCSMLMAQNESPIEVGQKVIIDNDKMKVVEHTSISQGEVCGAGMHSHEPHLTVVLTDAKVLITPENGESQEIEAKSGSSFWFGASETHTAINTGYKPIKMILVYLKEK